MQVNVANILWLDRSQIVSINDLVDLSGLSQGEILELVDVGALAPINPVAPTWMFGADCVVTARKASQLRDDLELDIHAMALVINLLAKIGTLEQELLQLRVQQPAY